MRTAIWCLCNSDNQRFAKRASTSGAVRSAIRRTVLRLWGDLCQIPSHSTAQHADAVRAASRLYCLISDYRREEQTSHTGPTLCSTSSTIGGTEDLRRNGGRGNPGTRSSPTLFRELRGQKAIVFLDHRVPSRPVKKANDFHRAFGLESPTQILRNGGFLC